VAAPVQEPVLPPEMGRIGGKRGRNDMPAQILEVDQAELMKNRPKQDKSKLTGLAFGPSYQVSHANFVLLLLNICLLLEQFR
jgi:proline-rich protein PRCC